MRSLNPDQLRTLTVVAKAGGFSAAARALNLTQPAVSVQIRELEERVGLRLLDRIGKTVRPTAAGRELIGYAERIIAETDRALAAMRGHRQGHAGRVHLGTGPTALNYLLPPVLLALRESHPDVELVVTTGTTEEICERMRANVVDLGLIALPVDEERFDAIPLRCEPMVAIFRAGDPGIPAVATPAALAGRPLILEYQHNENRLGRAWLKAGKVAARPGLQLDGIEAIKDAVAAGLGVAIVPEPALGGGSSIERLAARPLDPPFSRTLALVQRRDKAEDPALRLVRAALLALAHGADRRGRARRV